MRMIISRSVLVGRGRTGVGCYVIVVMFSKKPYVLVIFDDH
jgi:hypothetical protein